MNERLERAVRFWSRMAEEADNEVSALDRTVGNLKKDVDSILKTFPLTPDSKVLDLCCGNGLLAFAISAKVREVVGVDMSPVMLERTNRVSKGENGKNVAFINGEAVSLPFKDDSFDFSYCMTSFHYFPNIDYAKTVISEIIRVTKSTGMILLTDIPLKDGIGYHIWNFLRSRKEGYNAPIPQKRGERGIVERLSLLSRRFSGRKVDSDEWLWYRKEIFQDLKGEKFRDIRFFPSRSRRIINYRFDVLISNRRDIPLELNRNFSLTCKIKKAIFW